MALSHELQARIQDEVLVRLYALWGKGRDEEDDLTDYQTFLHETQILNQDAAQKNKSQRLWRTSFQKGVIHGLFADWANTQIANGRDPRECVFGVFVEENDLLVKERTQ
jgi:hypothetical protein